MSTRIVYVRIKYSMYDLISDVIVAVFKAAILVKSMYMIKSQWRKKEKKRKWIKVIHKSPSERDFGMEFTAW